MRSRDLACTCRVLMLLLRLTNTSLVEFDWCLVSLPSIQFFKIGQLLLRPHIRWISNNSLTSWKCSTQILSFPLSDIVITKHVIACYSFNNEYVNAILRYCKCYLLYRHGYSAKWRDRDHDVPPPSNAPPLVQVLWRAPCDLYSHTIEAVFWVGSAESLYIWPHLFAAFRRTIALRPVLCRGFSSNSYRGDCLFCRKENTRVAEMRVQRNKVIINGINQNIT